MPSEQEIEQAASRLRRAGLIVIVEGRTIRGGVRTVEVQGWSVLENAFHIQETVGTWEVRTCAMSDSKVLSSIGAAVDEVVVNQGLRGVVGCSSSAETGLQAALAQAAWIERAPASIFLGHHQRALETAAELKALKLGEALAIEFGDDSDRTLRCVVIPGESIKFGYGSNEEEAEAVPLVERCARALGCDIDVV